MKFLTVLTALLVLTWLEYGEAGCGYKSCPSTKSGMINVHLVPHSHDDAGWLKTVDQYYYGSRNDIQHAGVQYILDNVIVELLKNKSRRFIQVETAFFQKWYNEQSSDVKKNVKKLVDDGRLEFAGGAWSMNDEAAVHYQSVIDQFTVGLKFLTDTFGSCGRPTIGWQIDPFGHSREMASLFAQMGFDGQFFARMDFVEKDTRLDNLTAEMIWKASDSLGQSAELFTGLLYNHYAAPDGFCFDSLCNDKPIIDGDSYDNNVKERVDTFIAYINKMSKTYRSTHLLVPMGDDFNYENANMNYKNLDKLIKYVNQRQLMGTKINLLYSTPACYLNALHESTKLTWPSKTQDFFPYGTDNHTYWSGYFSSRPTQKKYERDGNHFLQVTKQLTTLANLTTADMNQNLDKLRQVMGIMQHHDAITGTEKQHVAADYDRLLTDALVWAQNNTRMALQKLTNLTNGEFISCLQLNISLCEFTQKSANNLVVTVFNPLSQPSTQYIRIPVLNGTYIVTDNTGKVINHQIVPVSAEVLALTDLRKNLTQTELVFEANVEKLANFYVNLKKEPKYFEYDVYDNEGIINNNRFLRYQARKTAADKTASAVTNEVQPRAAGDVVVQNSLVKLTFNNKGILYNIQMNGVSENVTQEFYYYKGALGNNTQSKFRSSGAYTFRPNGTELLVSPSATIKVFNGPLVKEVHQRFNEWVSQVIRLYERKNVVEFDWLVGPIPIKDNIGKEIITRFTSNIASKGVFYTDSNGREMLKRVRNQREYFKPDLTEKVSSNYYPVTARIALQNEKVRLALLNDRAQGGSSLKDGSLELMLHRRLLHDDAFGVGEALNETVYGKGLVARGKIHLILNQLNNKPTVQERHLAKELHLPYWKFFSSASKATNKKVPKLPIFSTLPKGIEVLTLEPFDKNARLLRLENILDKTESGNLSFNIRLIFDALGGEEIKEMTLDGNMKLSDMKRFKFQPDGTVPKKVEYYTSKHTPMSAKKSDGINKFTITLEPMQIRTFILKWK
ncbi:lysosomal alpha-mannosidase [Calliphora vicina]|uniref:lysosomal alpha-mannosidase n=1 Tax=Calliphora vicina TaxID=7373 RepID=UPI00325AF521